MAGSANRSNDTAVGCAGILGLCVLAVTCWLLWTAVTWAATEWRWIWFLIYAAAVPALAYGIVRTWGEERPFAPSRQREAWATAILTATAAAAPVVVLMKGWGTGVVALLFALASGVVSSFVPAPGRCVASDKENATTEAEDEKPAIGALHKER